MYRSIQSPIHHTLSVSAPIPGMTIAAITAQKLVIFLNILKKRMALFDALDRAVGVSTPPEMDVIRWVRSMGKLKAVGANMLSHSFHCSVF